MGSTTGTMFACLIIALMVGISLSWAKDSSLKKRNTDGTRTQSQETDGIVRLVRNSDDEDEDDNLDEEEDDSAEGGRNVRNRAQNVLQVFLEIHNHYARNKKSNKKSNITVYERRRAKKNGSEKQEVYIGK